ncbi:MAG: type II toxin-antitoxin system VapC family toxin [Deltaproteobacteria bacterium]|nr:type II toxin-antitoxin system VapC family toxin [Deltaproteobacteria bacterium]
MLYWDSSAVVASILGEEYGKAVDLAAANAGSVSTYTAIITPLEIESALSRRLGDRTLTKREVEIARSQASDFRRRVFHVVADLNLLDMAIHLQRIHGLRPGDAIQLASARVGTDDPTLVEFLCLDAKLNAAARHERFNTPCL